MNNFESCQNVTYKQIDMMKHSIGFDNSKITGIKHRKYEPYRNYYAAGETDKQYLDPLCELGLMEKSTEKLYHVTDNGRTFLKFVTGVDILEEMR